MIILKNISKRYPEGSGFRSVLEDITADIPETAFSVLLGPSGSGKSTLLNIISGIDLPTSGEIIINGQNLTNMNEKHRTLFRRTQIGIVFQAGTWKSSNRRPTYWRPKADLSAAEG